MSLTKKERDDILKRNLSYVGVTVPLWKIKLMDTMGKILGIQFMIRDFHFGYDSDLSETDSDF